MRFVALIRRADQAHLARPENAAPGPDWKLAHLAPGLAVWLEAGAKDPLGGRSLTDGYLVGATYGSASLYEQAAKDWGAYLAIGADGGSVRVLRDCSGRIPAYWARGPSFDVISSHLEPLANYVEDWNIDWPYLAQLLIDESRPGARTGFAQVQEILPGEELVFRAGQVSRRMAWTPSTFYGAPLRHAAEAARLFRAAAEASVEFWASRYQNLALDLSGGLDSTIMLGLLRRSPSNPKLICINARVAHAESDEQAFARDAAALHQAELVETALDDHLADYERSSPGPMLARPSTRLLQIGLGRNGLALARAAGAKAYVTGRGGDHLFFDHVPPTSATDYLRQTHDVPGWICQAYRASRLSGAPLREVLGHAFSAETPAQRLAPPDRPDDSLSTPEADARSAHDVFTPPWLLEAADLAPPAKFVQVGRLVELQRHYDRVGRAAEIEEIHPFIAQPMFEAAMRTPSYLFASSGVPRQLQRQTFADLLPASVLNRRSKGATTSHLVRTLEANLPYLRGVMLDGDLTERGLVDRGRLDARLTSPALRSSNRLMDLLRCVIVHLWLEEATRFTREARRARRILQLGSAADAGPPESWSR